jgi:hypothetical protein
MMGADLVAFDPWTQRHNSPNRAAPRLHSSQANSPHITTANITSKGWMCSHVVSWPAMSTPFRVTGPSLSPSGGNSQLLENHPCPSEITLSKNSQLPAAMPGFTHSVRPFNRACDSRRDNGRGSLPIHCE